MAPQPGPEVYLTLLTHSRVAHSCSETPRRELTPSSPALSGLSHKAVRSMCNLYSWRTLVVMTHCPYPGRAATNGCGNRACSHPHPYTHPFPPRHAPLGRPANNFFVRVSSGGREGERQGGCAGRTTALHMLQVTGSGDGTGQCPPVTPGLRLPADVSCNGK